MVTFAYEAENRLRVAFLGTSGHAFRNFLPSLPYAAVELVATWDPDATRAQAFGQLFGATSSYTDLDRLLREVSPDAVLIATTGFENDEPSNTSLLIRCLEAGCDVWVDKPVAARAETVDKLIALRDKMQKVVAVGVKTMHNPAYHKAREIVCTTAEFGRPASFMGRYPLHVPRQPGGTVSDPEVRSCLDHVWHPVGAALLIMGAIDAIDHLPAPAGSGGVALARFRNGVAGTFHFSAGQAETSPLERIEVVGEESNVVVDNAVHVTWYRRGSIGPYGRIGNFTTENAAAPLTWEPEMSLGQLYNNNNFLQGYAPSIISFVEAARGTRELRFGTLEDARDILHVFEMLIGAAVPA